MVTDGSAEAVIISGPMRGQIVTLREDSVEPCEDELRIADEMFQQFNAKLDQLEGALGRLSQTAREATEEIKGIK